MDWHPQPTLRRVQLGPLYIPKQFDEPRVNVMHALIRARPLATVVTLSSSGLNANHIPTYLSKIPAPFGVVRGHVARANPMLSDLTNRSESLAVFHGPDAFITPSWHAAVPRATRLVRCSSVFLTRNLARC